MKSSEQLEQETEEARARVNNTLEELRSRATPGQLVDQLIDYARGSGGGAFFNNLGRQVTDNPLPVVLLGTSIAWLAVASARPASRRYAASGSAGFSRAGERASDMAEEIGDRASDVGEQLSDRASELGDRVSERAADVRERLGERASDVRQRIGERAADVRERAAAIGDRVAGAARTASDAIESIRDRASNVYDTASQSARRAVASVGQAAPAVRRNVVDKSQSFVTLCKEQPIVLAGIGVALGATIGALLPVSSTENRLMGEAADDVKARARRLTDKVKEGAQTAYDEAKDAAGACLQPQGATSTQSQGSSAQSQGVMSTMEGSEAAKTAADLGHS